MGGWSDSPRAPGARRLSVPLELLELELRELHHLSTADRGRFLDEYQERTGRALEQLREAAMPEYAAWPSGRHRALHFAAGCGCLEICDALLLRAPWLGAAVDEEGRTALFWAAFAGLASTVALLVRKGCGAGVQDSRGRTALHAAAVGGFRVTCQKLLEESTAPRELLELRDKQGLAALHLAADLGHGAVCEELLVCGAVADVADGAGLTPLHLAAAAGHAPVVEQLLGADAALALHTDAYGRRPFHVARARGHGEATAVLEAEERRCGKLLQSWREQMTPLCPGKLNLRACDACLELGQPRLDCAGFRSLRVVCRVVDVAEAIERYVLEVEDCFAVEGGSADEQPAKVPFARRFDQQPLDDVAFDVPRSFDNEVVWEVGTRVRCRIVAVLLRSRAVTSLACSPWGQFDIGLPFGLQS